MTAALRIATDGDTLDVIIRRPAFAAVDRHPFAGGFGRRYYPAVATGLPRDLRFAVLAGDEPLLYAPAVAADGSLGYYGMPLRFVLADQLDARMIERAVQAAFAHIDALVTREALSSFTIETDGGTVLDAVGEACLGRGCGASVKLVATVDLAADEALRRAALRKSYRSLVNWGSRAIALHYVNGAAPDRTAFDAYQAFHQRVAGRVTRAQESWEVMFSWIAGGGGELALGHLDDGSLVSATLVVDGTACAYYASGVYDRDRFDKPMAHWPLWNAIERARGRGMSVFDLGEIPLPGAASEKEAAVGYFKRGFAQALSTGLVWTLPARR